jgi:hypothetical protein
VYCPKPFPGLILVGRLLRVLDDIEGTLLVVVTVTAVLTGEMLVGVGMDDAAVAAVAAEGAVL